MIAVSFGNGKLQILSTNQGEILYDIDDKELRFPVFSMCWKPNVESGKNSQKLIGVAADGRVISWTIESGEKLQHHQVSLDEDQHYQAVGYSSDGKMFCAAGDKPSIEVFDDETL